MAIAPEITASIVVYNEKLSTLTKSINSFVESKISKTLYIIDNSPNENLGKELNHPKIKYIYSGSNLGFGKGHNKILEILKENPSDSHLILNPDIVFDPVILEPLFKELKSNETTSMIAPKILNPDGSIQYTARRFPTLSEQLYRFLGISSEKIKNKEYRDLKLDKPFSPDFVHGSFMLFKTQDWLDLNGFDERYFMYMEDVDICKRIYDLGKKVIYYPKVTAMHEFRKGSSKSLALFFTHCNSMIKYYKKWGF